MSEQPNLNAVNAAIAAAKQAAANTPAPVAQNANLPAAAPIQGGRAVSLREAVAEAPMRADVFISVSEHGFTLGKDKKTLIEIIPVSFKLSQAKAFYGVRYGKNPAKYERSYDRIVNSRTKQSWADTVNMAMRVDTDCKGDYTGVDVLFTATDDVKSIKGDVVLAKGKTLMWTSSITNFPEFSTFIEPYLTLQDAGILPSDATLQGTLFHFQKEGGGNTWGALGFKDDFEAVDLGETKAAA